MIKKARFWELKGSTVHCCLCPHNCLIKSGKRGKCNIREHRDGALYSILYAACSSITPDPIEKKPLYHFHPGHRVLSLGTLGCNLSCYHCQNHTISQAQPKDLDLIELSPKDAATAAKRYECQGIAYTYNEPTVWWEYTLDSAKIAKQENLYAVYVTNGFTSEDPIREIAPYLDAVNIDIKSMNNDFYHQICGGQLQPVLDACKLYYELGIHLELTYLVIPGHNDTKVELGQFARWVVDNLSHEVPVHFSAFYPHYKMTDVPHTPISKLETAYKVAKQEGLSFIYLGNVPNSGHGNTYCPECGTLLIERNGFLSQIKGLKKSSCANCNKKIPVITD